MPLKTMPNAMPCSPQKCRVDGTPHYLVPVSMWHDHEDDAREAHTLQARVNELEADLDRYRKMVSPANAIDLGEFIGPVKPCPFCGSVALERDGFEEHIVCGNCGASAPVGGWQFRAPQP